MLTHELPQRLQIAWPRWLCWTLTERSSSGLAQTLRVTILRFRQTIQ